MPEAAKKTLLTKTQKEKVTLNEAMVGTWTPGKSIPESPSRDGSQNNCLFFAVSGCLKRNQGAEDQCRKSSWGEGNDGGSAGYLWAAEDWAQGADDKQLGEQGLRRKCNGKGGEREG